LVNWLFYLTKVRQLPRVRLIQTNASATQNAAALGGFLN
jgi:hypothetical protein